MTSPPSPVPDVSRTQAVATLRPGPRSAGALSEVHLAVRLGSFDLDVLVRDMERPRGVEVLGQLTRADDLHVPAPDVGVLLVSASGSPPLSSARTGAFGAFRFPRRRAEVLGLRLDGARDAAIALVWDRRADADASPPTEPSPPLPSPNLCAPPPSPVPPAWSPR